MEIDYQALKAGGIIKQKQKDLFSIRIRIPLGNVTSEQLKGISAIADRVGRGIVHLTMRQGIEIPYINIDDINNVIESLKEVNLQLGACGPRVRVITSCQGNTLCLHGLGDSQQLATKLDERYYGRSGIPHKFKIGVSGCPNSCIKPQENDVGFIAVAEPLFDGLLCSGCGLCVEICLEKAIRLVADKPIIDLNKCSKDAKCVLSCPVGALKIGKSGWDVYAGGKWGRKPQLGIKIFEFLSTSESISAVGKILNSYINQAKKGERLGTLINRIGIDKFKEALKGQRHNDEAIKK